MVRVMVLPAFSAMPWGPAPMWPPEPRRPASMLQCLLLAALVHALLVLVFGSTQGGTAEPGQGVFSRINVTLRGLPERGRSTERAVEVPSGPVGSARDRRFGGAVRDESQAPRSNDGPGAARQGVWSSTPSEGAEAVSPGVSPPVPEAPPGPSAAGAAAPAQTAPLARIVPLAPQAQPVPTPAPAVGPPAAEARMAPPTTADTPSRAERTAPQAAESRPSDAPSAAPSESEARLKMVESPPLPAAPATLPSPAPPSSEAGVTTPAPMLRETAPRESRALALPSLPASAPRASERLSVAPLAPATLPNVAATPQAPAAQLAPVPLELRTAPTLPGAATLTRESAPRTEPVALPALTPTPDAPGVRLDPAVAERALPPLIGERATAVPRLAPVAPAPQLASPAATQLQSVPAVPSAALPAVAAERAAPGVPGASPTTTPSASPGPATAPAPSTGPTLAGRPDAGPRTGQDIATPPSQPASRPPLNLELPRPRGGEIARDPSRSVLNLLPPPPERKPKLAQEIEKSARPDCRDAYAGLGILAPIPLAVDALRDKGCKW